MSNRRWIIDLNESKPSPISFFVHRSSSFLLFERLFFHHLRSGKTSDSPNVEKIFRGDDRVTLRDADVRRLKGNVFRFDGHTDGIAERDDVSVNSHRVRRGSGAFDQRRDAAVRAETSQSQQISNVTIMNLR